MQHLRFQNTKLFSYEDTQTSSLPTKEEYFALESHKKLISVRPVWITVVLRLLMVLILSFGVPLGVVLIWGITSFVAYYWLAKLSEAYKIQALEKPRFSTEAMRRTSTRFKYVYEINCFIWASASFLAQFWLFDLPRILVHILLISVFYVFLTRNYTHLKVMYRASLIFLGLPIIAGVWKYLTAIDDQHELHLFIGLSFYLCLNGVLIWMLGMRFNKMFFKECESEYSNIQLIESLQKSQEKLYIELEALIEANAVIQQFYSAAAHDLRQPVYAMEIYTDMLREDPSKLETLLPKIAQSCMSINAMFNDLFDFQQKHLGDTQLEVAKLNIADTLKSLALHFEPIAASKNLGISFKALVGSVETIPLYLVRILSNLIANAITYTPAGRILVAARKSGNFLSFEIWDTGPGIDKAAHDKIFDEFYKVNPDGRTTSNLGLGLAIVKELVKRLEGAKVRVNSVVGKGTVFKLLLPITTYSAAQEPKPIESTMHYDL